MVKCVREATLDFAAPLSDYEDYQARRKSLEEGFHDLTVDLEKKLNQLRNKCHHKESRLQKKEGCAESFFVCARCNKELDKMDIHKGQVQSMANDD